LAKAIEECVAPVHVRFAFCNLDRISQQLLADAVAKNHHLTGFSCYQNPYNFDANGKYLPESDEVFKMALIASRAPLKIWNNQVLPVEIVEKRRERMANATVEPMLSSKDCFQALKAAEDKMKIANSKLPQLKKEAEKCKRELETNKRELEQKNSELEQKKRELEAIQNEVNSRVSQGRVINGNLSKLTTMIEAETKHVETYMHLRSEMAKSGFHVEPLEALATPPPPLAKECTICNEEKSDRAVLNKCGHAFCRDCAEKEFQRTKTCPFCRQQIVSVIPLYE
jgi:hypothetical protein